MVDQALEVVSQSNTGEPWLSASRVRGYSRLCALLFATIALVWLLSARHMVDLKGKPVGCDFITFWSASRLALTGHAADAYDIAKLFAVEKQAVPAANDVFAWYYPPAFYLLVLPLGTMPYGIALIVFTALGLGLYLGVFRSAFPGSQALWCLAGFSGLWINLLQGQNGFLTAALAAGGLLAMERAPGWAGVLFGLLVIKPHLALLVPVALVAARAWRTLLTAALTAAAATALGVLVLGLGVLRACLTSLTLARHFVEDGSLAWSKMPTLFGFVRLLGGPVALAYMAHALGTVAATVAVWMVWRRTQDWQLRGAAFMTGTLLVSPYLFDYDLAWLAFASGWMIVLGLRVGWLRGEREVLLAAWLLPFAMAPLGMIRLQPGPWVLCGLLACVARRTGASRTPADVLSNKLPGAVEWERGAESFS